MKDSVQRLTHLKSTALAHWQLCLECRKQSEMSASSQGLRLLGTRSYRPAAAALLHRNQQTQHLTLALQYLQVLTVVGALTGRLLSGTSA